MESNPNILDVPAPHSLPGILGAAIPDEKVISLIASFREMTTKDPKGRGSFLGNGLGGPSTIRAFDLADLLEELMAWRSQVPDFEYYPHGKSIVLKETND